MRVRPVLALVLALAFLTLAGCDYPAAHAAPGDVTATLAEPTAGLQSAALDVVDSVQSVVPPAPADTAPTQCDLLATELIVKWEIGSPARYTARYESVIWPGGASGPTWGVGYDGGQQTRFDIRADWAPHPQVDALEQTAGVAGQEARTRVRGGEWDDVRTPYPLAEAVFQGASLPAYRLAMQRALHVRAEQLPPYVCAALVDVGYNRGWAMLGDRNREKREIRDTCLPAADTHCIAAQLRAMKRLWPDTPGLQNRREDEARLALTSL